MKKTYFEPTTEMVKVAVSGILMNSLEGAGGQNVTMETESSFDSFFGS